MSTTEPAITDLSHPQPGDHPHTAALRRILAGSQVKGRWLIQCPEDLEDGEEAATPEMGEPYDCPQGYDEHDRDVVPPGCYWEPYNADEQARWFETVVDMCMDALSKPVE
jgi:hypothetical protein